ncbi:speckle-type POZ protein B-like [Daphnia magna]|uniref:speckle-type POZ protein B-like n=1 Tax=Daphnia magna TaxID=35525 RepID=UPI001E1BC402|nr:speckle-type POZ protein B-like [Daphnia magna]
MVEALKHTTDYLFLQQSHCDVQFCFPNDEKPIRGHVKILSSRSSIFAAMFQHDMQEFKTGQVVIQDTERDIFYQLVHYIYSGRTWTSLNEGTAQKLLLAADKYNVTGLSIECTSYLISNITWERAVDLMIWAHVHSIDKVKEAALDIVAKNGKQICPLKAWEGLVINYPHLCLEATRRMIA